MPKPGVSRPAEDRGAGLVLPAVRLAPAHELATAVLAAPLLREAQRLARWVGADRPVTARGLLRPADAAQVIDDLDMAVDSRLNDPPAQPRRAWRPRSAGDVRELDLVWRAAVGCGLIVVTGRRACAARSPVHDGNPGAVLRGWRGSLDAVLRAGPPGAGDEIEGLATVLYAAGRPVRMDVLAEAFTAATRARRSGRGRDRQARMSQALEVLADLGAAEVGLDEQDEQLTVTLTPLGICGVRKRLMAAGFHAPVAGRGAASNAAGLLSGLAGYDADDGELEIAAWLAHRTPERAAAELLEAAGTSSPGARGAAFAIIDRLSDRVVPLMRSAMANPVLRPHVAIWLREHGVPAELRPGERAWLLVDLGAGLLEEADPRAVAGDLLPDLPVAEQARLVGDLWQVRHSGLIGLLTTLTEHHPDPAVVKAARKAAFKARSQHLGTAR